MEKEQPDSLATVAVVSEKMPQTHSHYAPSEVYSTTEPPPAYMRPMKSTAVQIARIAAITLVTMSVVLGSFILAASWVQARASCTPESIAAMQAELKLQQQAYGSYQPQGEFLKHLQPEALVQEPVESKDSLQSLAAPAKKEVEPDTKDMKAQGEGENNSKSDNENGDRDDDDDDYDDDEFPPVHIKLPLQLDLDDIAGTLIQQARSRVSCVVERRRADEVMDGTGDNGLDNSTDPQRFQRLSGERVAILCESGNPNQEQQPRDYKNNKPKSSSMNDHLVKMTNSLNHFDVYVESVNQRTATGTDIWENGRMNSDLSHEVISKYLLKEFLKERKKDPS